MPNRLSFALVALIAVGTTAPAFAQEAPRAENQERAAAAETRTDAKEVIHAKEARARQLKSNNANRALHNQTNARWRANNRARAAAAETRTDQNEAARRNAADTKADVRSDAPKR